MNQLRQYVDDLLKNVQAIEQFTSDGYDAFMEDIRTQYAVMRAYEIIGEITKRLPADVLARYPTVRWRDISGFRDVLIHRYNEVKLSRVWQAVEDLPTLRAAVEAMLRDLETEAGDTTAE
jgi:uncharacterized protein with HEPN domain